jgi:hypothetical protein
MDIKVSQLRTATERLLAHLESKGDTVNVEADFYWNIPAPARYNPYEEPKELTLGQLSDDWGELSRIAEGEAEPINYALVWLGAVMTAIGEQVGE